MSFPPLLDEKAKVAVSLEFQMEKENRKQIRIK